jgi:DNA repair protein RadC
LAKALHRSVRGSQPCSCRAAPRLKEVEGVGDKVVFELKLMQAVGHRMARARVIEKPILSSWDALLDYCQTAMAHRDIEQFRVLYLDRKNVLIADEAQADGTVDHVPVYPREIVKRALELNASALILVHNHPSGDPTPSRSDIDMTFEIQNAAELLGIVLHDHLVSRQGARGELSVRRVSLRPAYSTQTSTRRFTARPQSVSSQAIGRASPKASARSVTRASALSVAARTASSTVSARRCASLVLIWADPALSENPAKSRVRPSKNPASIAAARRLAARGIACPAPPRHRRSETSATAVPPVPAA